MLYWVDNVHKNILTYSKNSPNPPLSKESSVGIEGEGRGISLLNQMLGIL
jgi:hypothetical protein